MALRPATRTRATTSPLRHLDLTLLLSTIGTFSDFATVYSITGGGPMNSTQVLATLSYSTALGAGRMGEGAAISLTMFPFLLVLMIWQIRWLMSRQTA